MINPFLGKKSRPTTPMVNEQLTKMKDNFGLSCDRLSTAKASYHQLQATH